MVSPFIIAIILPRKISNPPSVTMKAGIRRYAVSAPCMQPIINPMKRVNKITSGKLIPCFIKKMDAIPPKKPTKLPTDKSILPLTITSNIPIASIPTMELCRTKLVMFAAERKIPSVAM